MLGPFRGEKNKWFFSSLKDKNHWSKVCVVDEWALRVYSSYSILNCCFFGSNSIRPSAAVPLSRIFLQHSVLLFFSCARSLVLRSVSMCLLNISFRLNVFFRLLFLLLPHSMKWIFSVWQITSKHKRVHDPSLSALFRLYKFGCCAYSGEIFIFHLETSAFSVILNDVLIVDVKQTTIGRRTKRKVNSVNEVLLQL